MEVIEHKSLEDALKAIVTDEVDHILVRHTLTRGEEIAEHSHPNVDEYLILNKGEIRIILDGETKEIDSDNFRGTTVIKIPKGKPHSLTSLSDIRYYVLRTGQDETLYTDRKITS